MDLSRENSPSRPKAERKASIRSYSPVKTETIKTETIKTEPVKMEPIFENTKTTSIQPTVSQYLVNYIF